MRERVFPSALQRFVVFSAMLVAVSALSQTASKTPRLSPLPAPRATRSAGSKACAPCIRAEMNFLASDALRGRGSGTADELVAATYVASQLQQYGAEPAGDEGTFIQRAPVEHQNVISAPQLHFMTPGDGIPAQRILWTHGKEMMILYLVDPNFKGPLQRVQLDRNGPALRETALHNSSTQREAPRKTTPGAVVLVLGKDERRVRAAAFAAAEAGAAAVLIPASTDLLPDWDERGKSLPKLPKKLESVGPAPAIGSGNLNLFALSQEALASLNEIPDGTTMYFEAAVTPPEKGFTWNTLAKISGSDPQLRDHAILLSAHLDHLGIGAPVNGDPIYNGADDDASGTVAVLELARALASSPRPKRTVMFAFFGSEEEGGLGSSWLVLHPPLPLDQVAADLELEMIGRPDPKYPGDSLWLSGWERSNLGPALAAHGARLVPDARPQEHFFQRSDNYVFAKKGVIAQTASSFGLHPDYHQPSDDLSHIDFRHMNAVITSLIPAIEWLANSNFKPEWKPGGKP
jgi:peptidase M28-like protein